MFWSSEGFHGDVEASADSESYEPYRILELRELMESSKAIQGVFEEILEGLLEENAYLRTFAIQACRKYPDLRKEAEMSLEGTDQSCPTLPNC